MYSDVQEIQTGDHWRRVSAKKVYSKTKDVKRFALAGFIASIWASSAVKKSLTIVL